MKIIKLEIENVKRITVVEITPVGNMVEINGPNASGKTSVLDSIYWLLAGTKDMDRQPIRRGASEAIIKADLGDLKVTRKLTATGTTLTIERADGTRLEKPQAILDRLTGKLAFDPLGFSRMKPKEQFEQLRKLVKLSIDMDEMDKLNASDFAKRTDLNREAKAMRAREATGFPPDLPKEPIDITELSNQVAAAVQANADTDREKESRATIRAQIDSLAKRAVENRMRAESIRAEAAQKVAAEIKEAESREESARNLQNEQDRKQPLPGMIVVDDLKKKIAEAVETNKAVERKRQSDAAFEKANSLELLAGSLGDAIEGRERKKREAIASAKMPVAGLGFGKDEVMLNDLPFEQASDAEQLRASCAIAMAMNPDLRILRVRDGSLLDDNGLKLLSEMAELNDYQIWIERVSDDSTVGIVMEEGHVKAPAVRPDLGVADGTGLGPFIGEE